MCVHVCVWYVREMMVRFNMVDVCLVKEQLQYVFKWLRQRFLLKEKVRHTCTLSQHQSWTCDYFILETQALFS